MYARRTESLDAIEIEKLITPNSIFVFGKPNLVNIIEKALLSITLTSKDGDIIGYASFYDYPLVSEIDSGDDWNKLVLLTDFELANPLNSFFMHYFLAKPEFESNILLEIINTVFSTASNIHYIFMNTNKDKIPDVLSKEFKPIKSSLNSSSNWFGLKREAYMPTLFIRLAKPEDMDDLAPIFNEQTSVLRKIYGEFYLAEMIESQNESMKCLVAEVGGLAVGFISVSLEANLDVLNYGFYTEPFNGFKKNVSHEGDDLIVISEMKNDDLRSLSTEHSVPVEIPDDQVENSLSDSTTSRSISSNYNQFQFPSSMSMKNAQLLDLASLPQYDGSSNAIIIQLFAINEIYEMRSLDFLLKVFELFPTRDYLLVTVPFLVPEFNLLENFVRVTPRPVIILPHELYAFHRGSLIDKFNIRQACSSDQEGIEKLINSMQLNTNILSDLEEFHLARRFKSGVNLFIYVAECLNQIVGIVIMKQEEDIEYIRSHYNIEDFIYFNHHKREGHGHIKHFAINPIFKRLAKQFLKEVMRKSHKTSIYYPIYKPWATKALLDEHSLATNLQDMVPVRPRRQIQYDIEKLEENAPVERVLQKQEGFCLMHFNRKLTIEPKITINARIVVIGASTTGLSFLESLAFCPHLKFNNLYLVSPNGMPDNYPHDEYLEQLMGTDFYFSKSKMELSALRMQVHVVKGHMTSINRKKKQITIDKKYLLAYDHMIITTGLQYSIPCPTEAKIKDLPNTMESPHLPSRRYSELVFKKRMEKTMSKNLFCINDPFDGVKLLEFVRANLLSNDQQLIVFGDSFEAYCCLHTILAMGVAGYRIHFVKPPIEEEIYPLNNPIVEEAVYNTLREAGVSIHENYCVAQFNDSDDIPDWIYSVSFTTHGSPLRLECSTFISYYNRAVNYLAFRAMNDACLVFDARLVIDTFFHTNDIDIRAAGPVTKFKRRYYNEQWHHGRFNSKTVGEELSKVFLRLFDPTLIQISSPPIEEIPLIPMYDDAIIKSCILPGGYHYLSVSKPSLDIPLASMMAQANYGTVFTTGGPCCDQGYFRIHLNQYKKVETITCLRKKPYPIDNYIQLYGMHERALNNLESRFKEDLISDLFEFFDDTWAMAFYHDRFKDLREEIKELMMTRSTPCTMSFEETARSMMVDGVDMTKEQRNELMAEYVKSNAKSTVDQRLISFIAYNYYHLPMYAKPDLV